jgi:hypothetical protein
MEEEETQTTTTTATASAAKKPSLEPVLNTNPEFILNVPFLENHNGFVFTRSTKWRFTLDIFLYLNRMTSKILFYCLKRHLQTTTIVSPSDPNAPPDFDSSYYVDTILLFFRCLVKLTIKFNIPLGDYKYFVECKKEGSDPYNEYENVWDEHKLIGLTWEGWRYGVIHSRADYNYYLPTMLTFLIRNFDFFSFHEVEHAVPKLQFLDIEMFFVPSEFTVKELWFDEPMTVPFLYDAKASATLLCCATDTSVLNGPNQILQFLELKETDDGRKSIKFNDRRPHSIQQPEAMKAFSETLIDNFSGYLEKFNRYFEIYLPSFALKREEFQKPTAEEALNHKKILLNEFLELFENARLYFEEDPGFVTNSDWYDHYRKENDPEYNYFKAHLLLSLKITVHQLLMEQYGLTVEFGISFLDFFRKTHVLTFESPFTAEWKIVADCCESPFYLDEKMTTKSKLENGNTKQIGRRYSHRHRRHNENKCAECNAYSCVERPLLVCGRCEKTYYCNVECQRKHWGFHKRNCS